MVAVASLIVVLTLSAVTNRVAAVALQLTGLTAMGVGVLLVLLISRSRLIDRWMCSVIAWALTRWTELDTRDYANLPHLSGGYGVLEARVGPVLAGKAIGSAGLQRASRNSFFER